MAVKSKVLSLRISNKNLASCIAFEELLKDIPSAKLTTGITLLIESSIRLLNSNGTLPTFTDFEAEEKIKDFLKNTGRSVIGKEEVLKRAQKLESIRSRTAPRNSDLSPFIATTPPDPPLLEPEGEETEIPTEEKPTRMECYDRRETERLEEKQIINAFEEEIEMEVEVIRAEEDLELMKKIFLFSTETETEKEKGEEK